MGFRPPKAYKVVTDELARLAASSIGSQLFQMLGRLNPPAEATNPISRANQPEKNLPEENVRPVGIWHPYTEGRSTVFVRSHSSENTLWARRERIVSKGGKRRIIFTGESAARGHFYDPHANCASVLESMLNSGGDEWAEVIDLARTDMLQPQLIEVLQASTALEPNAIVVFAGNNWAPFHRLSWFELAELGKQVLQAGSWLAARCYLEDRLRLRVRQFLRQVRLLSTELKIPVVLVVPEFNLADWSTNGPDLPFLEPEATRQWLEMAEAAEGKLTIGHLQGAAALAEKMTALDGGATPRPLEILGRLELERGNPVQARNLLEQARDTAMLYPQQNTPRCYTPIQRELRTGASYGLSVVDLPARFEEHLNGIPGRQLFMDYCHLTFEGIQVAMASVAETLLPLMRKPARPWRELAEHIRPPLPRVLGMASLMAALMNSSHKQDQMLVQQRCEEALEFDPALEKEMRCFMDFLSRKAPFALCASFHHFAIAFPDAAAYYMNPFPSDRRLSTDKYPQPGLLEAITRVLKKTRPTIASECHLLQLKEHGLVSGRSVNLRERYFQPELYGGAVQGFEAFYKAHSTRSRFRIFCGLGNDVLITVCCRVPAGATEEEAISLRVNGQRISSIRCENEWTTNEIRIPASLLHEGWNELEIIWPSGTRRWKQGIEYGLQSLYQQADTRPAHFYPVFGEISELTAACH